MVLLAYQMITPSIFRTSCNLRKPEKRSWNSQIKRDYCVFGKYVPNVYLQLTELPWPEGKGGRGDCLCPYEHLHWTVQSPGQGLRNNLASRWVNHATEAFLENILSGCFLHDRIIHIFFLCSLRFPFFLETCFLIWIWFSQCARWKGICVV